MEQENETIVDDITDDALFDELAGGDSKESLRTESQTKTLSDDLETNQNFDGSNTDNQKNTVADNAAADAAATIEKSAPDAAATIEKAATNAADAQPAVNLTEHYQSLNQGYETLTAQYAEAYESGELSYKEVQAKQAQLNVRYQEERGKLDAQAQVQQVFQQSVQAEREQFFKDNADLSESILYGALAAVFNDLIAKPESAGKSQAALLTEAATAVRGRFGSASTGNDAAAQALQDKRKAAMAAAVSVSGRNTAVQGKESDEALFERLAKKAAQK